ncbi:MAG: hypothetical protein AB8G05_03460 [Oligoflexales bacterium]
MAIYGRKRLSIFFACILLSMILSRLVWMQLRTYQLVPSFGAFSTFSYISSDFRKNCRNNSEIAELFTPLRQEAQLIAPSFHRWFIQPSFILVSKEICAKPEPIQFIIHMHWICLALIVLLGIFLARFLSSSWCLAIFVGATLMSRGALLALIGSYSDALPLTLLMTLWFTSCIHYLRTLSNVSLTMALTATILGSMLTGSFIGLGLAIPCFLFILKRKPVYRPIQAASRGYLSNNRNFKAFSPLRIRFSMWINRTPNLRKQLLFFWLILTAVLISMQVSFKAYQLFYGDNLKGNILEGLSRPTINTFSSFLSYWLFEGINTLDLHSLFSIAIIFLWGFSSQLEKTHEYTKEAILLFMVCFGILFSITLFTGYLDFIILGVASLSSRALSLRVMHPTPFLVWLEPIILTLGIIGLYHMLKRKTVSLER